jgi:hypothetical protein
MAQFQPRERRWRWCGTTRRGWRRVGNGDGATGLATARRDGVGDGSGMAMVTMQQGWRRGGVEAEGGVDDGDGDGMASRGTEGGSGVEGGKIGQPDGAKKFTTIRVSRWRGTPLIPDTLLISTDIVQSIPKM